MLDTAVQDDAEPCAPADIVCTVFVVELAASEVDHAAHS